jgi:hypothetical protein
MLQRADRSRGGAAGVRRICRSWRSPILHRCPAQCAALSRSDGAYSTNYVAADRLKRYPAIASSSEIRWHSPARIVGGGPQFFGLVPWTS